MDHSERILKLIFDAIDEANQQLPAGLQIEKSLQAALYDRTGKLDSLALVNLIVATEQRIEEEFGVAVTLADARAVSQERSPFRTVQAFARFIAERLKEHTK